MNCFHCGNGVSAGLDTVLILTPTSMRFEMGPADAYIDYNLEVEYGLNRQMRISVETMGNFCKFFHRDCFEIVAGKKYVP